MFGAAPGREAVLAEAREGRNVHPKLVVFLSITSSCPLLGSKLFSRRFLAFVGSLSLCGGQMENILHLLFSKHLLLYFYFKFLLFSLLSLQMMTI